MSKTGEKYIEYLNDQLEKEHTSFWLNDLPEDHILNKTVTAITKTSKYLIILCFIVGFIILILNDIRNGVIYI